MVPVDQTQNSYIHLIKQHKKMEQHFTTKQVSLHSVSITYHCILQQRKPPEALQCPGTADWLFLQQQTLDLSMGEKQNEKIYISIQLNSKYLKGATKK